MELYSIYCYSDEESEKETKVKINMSNIFLYPIFTKDFPKIHS